MKKNNIIFFVVGGIILVGAIFFMMAYLFREKKFIWSDGLSHKGDQPYDLVLFHDIFNSNFKVDTFNKAKFRTAFNSNSDFNNKGYLFIGEYPYHDVETAKLLHQYVRQGGTILIISNFAPDILFAELSKEEHLKTLTEDRLVYDSEIYLTSSINCKLKNSAFEKNNYTFHFKANAHDTANYNWAFIPENMIVSKQSIMGGFNDEENGFRTNFIKLNIGEGNFYWHRNPILFTNYYLSAKNENRSGYHYLNDILTIVNVRDWIWDKAEYISPGKAPKKFSKPKSPMEFIFSHQSLTWAWIMILITAGLYLLFGAKRRQNSIPVVEVNRNTSLEFINTISLLYYQQQNHKVIFERIMQLFRSHLRRRYGIHVKEDEANNSEVVKQIILKTDVEAGIVNSIFSEYSDLKSKLRDPHCELSSETLNKFHLLIDYFYKAEKNRKKSRPSLNQ